MADTESQAGLRNHPWTAEEYRLLWFEIKSKFWGGVRGSGSLITIVGNTLGIGYASFIIPLINGSEISAETLGIYVFGFGVSLVLASILAWTKVSGDSGSKYEEAVAQIVLVLGMFILVFISLLSFKWPLSTPASASNSSEPVATRNFCNFAGVGLVFWWLLALMLSIVLTGYDQSALGVSALDKPATELKNQEPKA